MRTQSSNQKKSKPLVVRLEVQGSKVLMQIDTRSSVSLTSEAMFQEKWRADNPRRLTICPSQTILCRIAGSLANLWILWENAKSL